MTLNAVTGSALIKIRLPKNVIRLINETDRLDRFSALLSDGCDIDRSIKNALQKLKSACTKVFCQPEASPPAGKAVKVLCQHLCRPSKQQADITVRAVDSDGVRIAELVISVDVDRDCFSLPYGGLDKSLVQIESHMIDCALAVAKVQGR